MGCGASAERSNDPVKRAEAEEKARVAPLLLRMETITNLRKEGLMTPAEYERSRQELLFEITGSTPSTLPKGWDREPQREDRARQAEEMRRQVENMAKQMQSNPDRLPDDYYAFLDALQPKFTREVQEQEEWRSASNGPMQEYYNTIAGRDIETIMNDRSVKLDDHRNPIGTQFDLPRDGTLQENTLVLLWFSKEGTYGKPVEALRAKGFKVVVYNASQGSTIPEMMVALLSADVAWLVSGSQVENEAAFEPLNEAMEAFHRRGGGLFVWGDNAPFFAHANKLLQRLFPGDDLSLQGNDHGSQIMRVHADGTEPGRLTKSHLIMTGLNSLFEGVTISYLSRVGPLKVLATYNDGPGYSGKTYCAVADAEVYQHCRAPYKMGRGRIVIDGGFTKLYDEFWSKTAGTERYVKNATAWLLNMNSRIISEEAGMAGAARERPRTLPVEQTMPGERSTAYAHVPPPERLNLRRGDQRYRPG